MATDVTCQLKIEAQPEMDWRRFTSFTIFGGYYTGGVCTFVYGSYKHILPAFMMTTPLRYGIGGTILDSFVHCPLLYTPCFYITTNLMCGQTLQYAIDELRLRYFESQLACLGFWLPVMAINFALIPARFNVATMQVANFCWNLIIDYIAHKDCESDPHMEEKSNPPSSVSLAAA